MKGLKYLITITDREYAEQYLEFFRKNGIERVHAQLCSGTATDATLDYLGLAKTKKIMFRTFVHSEMVDTIKNGLLSEMALGLAGGGIAVFISVDGIGGQTALKHLVGEKPVNNTEETVMDANSSKLVLIVTIADKGYSEKVMEAARGAGASGGTVIKAHGTGAEIAKFFGVSISEEKEMVYIVAKRTDRDAIMKAIMEKAGNNTDAHGIVYSLPVDSVAGVRSLENVEL
jgi:nitrogen regulatory protein PII